VFPDMGTWNGRIGDKGAVQVVHWGRARQFYSERKEAEVALKQWKAKVQSAQWTNFSDRRQTFSSADLVEGKVVFNICWNEFRLIAIVKFELGRLYIQDVMTDKEYVKGKWKR